MDVEAIKVAGTSPPPVRTTPARPPAQDNAQLGSAGGQGQAIVAEDNVTLSPTGRIASKSAEGVPGAKTKEINTQARLTIANKNEVVVQILDGNTGQVVREIPNKQEQALSQAIQETVSKLTNNANKK